MQHSTNIIQKIGAIVIGVFLCHFVMADPLFDIYMKRASAGDSDAQVLVGTMYGDGLAGAIQDYKQAADWYAKAANQGNADGQHMLGLAYILGRGVPEDHKQAYIWCSLSATNGSKGARKSRETASKLLSPAVLAQAQQEAATLAQTIQQRKAGPR